MMKRLFHCIFFLCFCLAACDPDTAKHSNNTTNNLNDAGIDILSDTQGPDADSTVDSGDDADSGPGCTDECDTEGLTACSDLQIRTCGNFDSDPCLEWSEAVSCDEGWSCDSQTNTCRENCRDFCDPFSVILLPDTQYYTSKQADTASNTYYKQMQWIIDHNTSDNIKFVLHLGDITNNNTTNQWVIANKAHQMLDTALVPYTVTTGNHDYLVSGDFQRSGSLFDDYFPPTRFNQKSWYGGHYGSSFINNYMYFTVGHMNFMVLSIEYSARKDVLCWADDVVAAHPDHHVILVTHCYLTHGGVYSGGCPDPDYNAIGASGSGVWNELVSRHSNIFLVVSGHIGDSEYRVRTTNTGSEVHEMLVDYQFEGTCSSSDLSSCDNNCRTGTYHGNGWMRQLVFNPRSSVIQARTFTVEDGNTAMFPLGNPAFFCSELFDPPVSDASGDNWYPSDPTSIVHQYDFTHEFALPPPTGYDMGSYLGFGVRTINYTSAGDQTVPKTILNADNSFIAVWEDDSDSTDGSSNHDIFLRGFAPGGCIGCSEFRVNIDGAGDQSSPAIAADASGNFVVAWEDDTDDNGVYQIHARGFYADGTERFSRITVNSVSAGQQRSPSIAMAPDGRFVVAWADDPDSNGNFQVLMRGFNADGTELFADKSVSDDITGVRKSPSVAMDSTGNFVVVWADDSDGNGSYQIHGRGFNHDGTSRFNRITVNQVADGQQIEPSVSMDSLGNFAVAWRDDAGSDGNYMIKARVFSTSGTQLVSGFDVSSSAGQHRYPSVSMNAAGGFVITWADDEDGNGQSEISAVRYNLDGSIAQARWTVNRVSNGEQTAPSVGYNSSGTIVFVWQDDMDGNGTYQIVGRGY